MSLVITIGRENGSGGREIGKRLAKELNLDFYDNNLISITAHTRYKFVEYGISDIFCTFL